MYIHWLGLLVMTALYIYLVMTDIHLHRRVQKLERTVRRLEGVSERKELQEDRHEHEDFT